MDYSRLAHFMEVIDFWYGLQQAGTLHVGNRVLVTYIDVVICLFSLAARK